MHHTIREQGILKRDASLKHDTMLKHAVSNAQAARQLQLVKQNHRPSLSKRHKEVTDVTLQYRWSWRCALSNATLLMLTPHVCKLKKQLYSGVRLVLQVERKSVGTSHTKPKDQLSYCIHDNPAIAGCPCSYCQHDASNEHDHSILHSRRCSLSECLKHA